MLLTIVHSNKSRNNKGENFYLIELFIKKAVTDRKRYQHSWFTEVGQMKKINGKVRF